MLGPTGPFLFIRSSCRIMTVDPSCRVRATGRPVGCPNLRSVLSARGAAPLILYHTYAAKSSILLLKTFSIFRPVGCEVVGCPVTSHPGGPSCRVPIRYLRRNIRSIRRRRRRAARPHPIIPYLRRNVKTYAAKIL